MGFRHNVRMLVTLVGPSSWVVIAGGLPGVELPFARGRGLFAKRSSVSEKRPGSAALVGHEGRWATLADLVPISHRSASGAGTRSSAF